MNVSRGTVGVGLVVLGLVAVAWCHGAIDRGDRAAAQISADSLRRVTDSLDAAHAADSIRLARRLAQLGDSLREAGRRQFGAVVRANALATAIAAMGDTMVPKGQVLEALAAKDSVIVMQAKRIGLLEMDTTAWRGRWLAAVDEGANWRRAATEAQRQLAAANKRSAPRWGCTGGITGLAGGGITGAPTGAVFGPTVGAGFGVTCGRHL